MSDTVKRADPRMARPDRDDPHSDERPGENRAFSQRDWEIANQPTNPEKRRALRERWATSLLPNLPKKAGWHRCWVSTSHPTDTVERRISNGYRVLKEDDLKTEGWTGNQSSVKDGSSVGRDVRCRELVGMECTEEDYQSYMREMHFDLPRDMAASIYEGLNEGGERIREAGGRVEIGEGLRDLARYSRPDRQFE